MARLRPILAGISVTLLLVAFFASPSSAGHGDTRVTVTITKGGTLVSEYSAAATGTGEQMDVAVSGFTKSELNRVVRYCGSATQAVTVRAGSIEGSVECPGNGGWSVRITAVLGPLPVSTHVYDVTITVRMTTAP